MDLANEVGLGLQAGTDLLGPLVTPADVLMNRPAATEAYGPSDMTCLKEMSRFLVEFLTAGDPNLGRPGAVCPFAGGAAQKNLMKIAASSLDTLDEGPLLDAMETLRDLFVSMESVHDVGRDEIYRSIVIVFPHLPAVGGTALIESVQKALKPSYVEQGLMIGEFYPGCDAPGLHNADFKPLNAPVISLAIRHITVFDAPFMLQDARCLESFERRFGEPGRIRVQKLLDARAGCPVTQIGKAQSASHPS